MFAREEAESEAEAVAVAVAVEGGMLAVENDTMCCVCHDSADSKHMLLCDECDLG